MDHETQADYHTHRERRRFRCRDCDRSWTEYVYPKRTRHVFGVCAACAATTHRLEQVVAERISAGVPLH